MSLSGRPAKFNLHCAANVAFQDLYKSVALQNLRYREGTLSGTLFNSGTQEITVPQLIISYYDEEKKLIWVDQTYLKDAIRIERSIEFSIVPRPLCELVPIDESLERCSVNGLPNAGVAKYLFPRRDPQHAKDLLQPISGEGYSYIKIEVNGYVGNPR